MTFQNPRDDPSGLPLGSLPAVVLDTETTGLDTKVARVVQIGAVRLASGEVDDTDAFDRLVDPGVPIPPESTEIHGITNADISGGADFAQVMPALAAWTGGTVVIGWSIGFDLAILKAEHERTALAWRAPRALDVHHLVRVLGPSLPDQALETSAAWLGVDVMGRHQALGDALVTARMFLALVPRLRERGICTLAQAERACRAVVPQLDEEMRAGWHEVAAIPPEPGRLASPVDSYPFRHRLREIMAHPPVTVEPNDTLGTALASMMNEQVSSVFVLPDAAGGAFGILTERDLLRAIAGETASVLNEPAGVHAVRPLVTLDQDEFVYRAMSCMSSRGFRHLGVKDSTGAIVGAISARDLLRQRAESAVALGQSIDAAKTVAELGQVWSALATVVRGLVADEVDPRDITAVISRELRALTRRACELAERELADAGRGGAPVPYAMIVLGSGGRGESLLAMDQDNAIIFAEGPPGGEADQWFEQLGKRVADILNEVGVAYCKGGVMASKPDWRKDANGWRETVADWVHRAQGQDILNADIFFDGVAVHGDAALAEDLHEAAMTVARGARTFLQFLAMNAAEVRSPLGMFGRLKASSGRVDLKQSGLMPLFGTARVLALRHGVSVRSTPGRLGEVQRTIESDSRAFDNLIEAHKVFLGVILRQQLQDLSEGVPLSNKIVPGALTAHQRQELRWALNQVPEVANLLGTPLHG